MRSHFSPAVGCVALCFVVGFGQAAEPVWYADYASARKEAEAQKKPILVVIGTDQCVYCRKLESTTFVDRDVLPLLSDSFINLKIDANKEPEFARAMRVTVYPTTVIAGSDGKIYAYLSGYLGPEAFRDNAKKAIALMPTEKLVEKSAVVASLKKDVQEPGADPLAVHVPRPEKSLVAPSPVKAVGPADAPKSNADVRDLLATAKAAYKADRFGECLEATETILRHHPGSTEAEQAQSLMLLVQADSEKLLRAGEQLDDKFAATYFLLGEGWQSKGREREAAACFEKAIRLAPLGKIAEAAQTKLTAMGRTTLGPKLER